jgi:non-heme chloroperoxidase
MKLHPILSAASLAISVAAHAQTGWVDPSPHQQRLVQVEPNVSLEVLDWGGSGPTLVLLPQLTQTAHIYDDWAPRLARTYRVLGITRRGFGQSSSATDGYSTERLAADVVAVLDAENLQNPILVGNGFAGEELSWIGARMPNRVAGLVYLDAAYDRSNVGAEGAIARRIPSRPPRPEDMESAQAVAKWMSRGSGVPIPESEVRQLAQLAPDGRVTGQRTPPGLSQKIIAGIGKPDYRSIRVPVLAIYAKRTSAESLPGCQGASDEAVRQACGELYEWTSRHLAESEQVFRTIRSRAEIIELPDANPFMFLSNEREIMQAMDRFLSDLRK